jgi:enoyl-CoA hydratase
MEQTIAVSLVNIDRTDPAIPHVVLNDPARYNALSGTLVSGVRSAFTELRADREARVIILRGAGRGFCAGADLSDGANQEVAPGGEGRGRVGRYWAFQEHLRDLILGIHECPKPVIAAVHGAAVGGGLAMALACDIRVCAEDAKFGARFIRVGMSSCDMGVSYLLPRIVGSARAGELMLTGRDFGASEAERIGMVHRAVPAAEVISAATDVAGQIAANSEYGVWMTKDGLAAGIDAPSLRHALELENRIQVIGAFTGNMAEAARAFVEKRTPVWKPF